MTKCLVNLVLGIALLTISAGFATAQTGSPATGQAAPQVESVDILDMNQNQAERSRVQPGNLAPTWRAVRSGENFSTTVSGLESGVLIQQNAQFLGQDRATTAGEAWRQYRNGPMTKISAWLLVIAVAVMAVVYVIFGPSRLKEPETGRLIQRFTPIERIAHWTLAISFVAMAVTGLLMFFGRYVLLPVFGYTLFGWLAYASKNIHNFLGPVFAISLIVVFAIFVKDNLPRREDVRWLTRLGGAIGKEHVSSGRFNAGGKIWFWGGVVVLGLIISLSGLFLDMLLPVAAYTRGNMQLAHVIHLIAAVLIMAASLGHIYLGTIGMEGAYAGMRTGYVDDTWARQHHDLWYDDVKSGKIPRVRSEENVSVVREPASRPARPV